MTVLQSKSGAATGVSLTVTLDDAPTEGNTLIAIGNSNNVITITGTWTQRFDGTGDQGFKIWSREAGASEPAAVTISPAATDYAALTVIELDGAGAFDVTGTVVTGSAAVTITASDITTTTDGDDVLAVVALHGWGEGVGPLQPTSPVYGNGFTGLEAPSTSDDPASSSMAAQFVGLLSQSTAGPVGATTVSWTNAAFNMAAVLIAFGGTGGGGGGGDGELVTLYAAAADGTWQPLGGGDIITPPDGGDGVPPMLPDFPTAATTGVTPGTALTIVTGDLHTTASGQTISGKDIRGTLWIDHNNVTVSDCKITGSGGDSWAIQLANSTAVSGSIIKNCTIDGSASDGGGIACNLTTNCGVYRCDISNGENAIRAAGHIVLQDNYLHDFVSSASGPHYDGIEIYAGTGTQVIHNYIDLDQSETSTVNVSGDFGPIVGTVIDQNYLTGGGWTINVRNISTYPVSGSVITNNRFGDTHVFGYGAVDPPTITTVTGNVQDTTGASVDDSLGG